MSEVSGKGVRARLKFVDLARSLAILLMLEGHFVGLTLDPVHRDMGHPVYFVWSVIRGFTAPLFFTVAGMIFVYLLNGENGGRYFERVWVRKGLVRSGQLLIWGYVLQLSLMRLPDYFRGEFGEWVFAFHVLQCIGMGLLALIGICWLHFRAPKIPLATLHLAAMILCLGIYLWLRRVPEGVHVPEGWPSLFQNMLRGPYSVFPVAPWFAFIFLGGAIGASLRGGKMTRLPIEVGSAMWFFLIAFALKLVWFMIVVAPDMDRNAAAGLAWFSGRSAEVIAFLGVLRWIETRFGIGVPWLLRVGTLTFSIYVIHVIILYSGLFGIGLNKVIKEKFGPWESAFGAVAFLGFFILLAQLIPRWRSRKATDEGPRPESS